MICWHGDGEGKEIFPIDTCLERKNYRSPLFRGVVKIEIANFHDIIAVNFFSLQSLLVQTTIFPNPVSNVRGTGKGRVDDKLESLGTNWGG